MTSCSFIPPYLLQRVATTHVDAEAARVCHRTLAVDEQLRARRCGTAVAPPPAAADTGWVVHSAEFRSELPGRPVRSEGQPPSGDVAVDEAYDGITASLDLFRDELGRDSFDGRGATVIASVHYERDYANAFWDGRQLVFGDGDGRVFDRFTKPIDVLGHELTHAVVQHTAGLVYQGQSGALNEHVSDVFASCMKQRVLGQDDPAAADWLIGEGIFLPSVSGRALRSMAEPGTAYDDPVLGRDRQVGHMDDFVQTTEDNGGVHINSGIPNRAFHLAALEIAEPSWRTAASIWYATLTSGIGANTDFATFARATLTAAQQVSSTAADAVARAWAEVGLAVTEGAPAGSGTVEAPLADPATVAVRRSGGFANIPRTGEVRLGPDPRTPEVEQLLSQIDVDALVASEPQPDRYVYSFWLQGREVTLPEQALTPALSRLVHLLLDD